MKENKRIVSLRRLPSQFDGDQFLALSREFESCINVDRPCVVLDCSMVERLDGPAIRFLLCCLEEAMKRNGDIRLAALPEESLSTFNSIGLDKLFRIFDDVDDATESFHTPRIALVPRELAQMSPENTHVDAA